MLPKLEVGSPGFQIPNIKFCAPSARGNADKKFCDNLSRKEINEIRIEKIRAKLLGKNLSEETKRKISVAQKRRSAAAQELKEVIKKRDDDMKILKEEHALQVKNLKAEIALLQSSDDVKFMALRGEINQVKKQAEKDKKKLQDTLNHICVDKSTEIKSLIEILYKNTKNGIRFDNLAEFEQYCEKEKFTISQLSLLNSFFVCLEKLAQKARGKKTIEGHKTNLASRVVTFIAKYAFDVNSRIVVTDKKSYAVNNICPFANSYIFLH